MDEALLLPLTETPVSEEILGAIHARLSGKRITGDEEIVEQAVRSGGVTVFPGWEFYAPVAGADHTIFDLLPRALVVEPTNRKTCTPSSTTSGRASKRRTSAAGSATWCGRRSLSSAGRVVAEACRACPARTSSISKSSAATMAAAAISFHTQPAPRFHGAVPAMLEEVKKQIAESKRGADRRAQHRRSRAPGGYFQRVCRFVSPGQPHPRRRKLRRRDCLFRRRSAHRHAGQSLRSGRRHFPDASLAIFGARDLFDESESVVSRPQRQKSKTSAFLSDFRDLQVGDYVVHVEHGIGQYQGLKEINQGDGNAEFMLLEYAEGARLYVPLTRLDLVQKYRSAEGAKPALNHLGTAAWAKTKARVRKAMKDMTDELLKLYAERKTAEGHAFSADNEWMREFEDAFEYSETEDQEIAIADVKRDMESPSPWTACSAATWATARRKSPCARLSRPSATTSRWRCWRPRRCSPSSTTKLSSSASRPFRSRSK